MVTVIDYILKVPKEGKEVGDLIGKLVSKLRMKAPIAEYSELLKDLIAAIDGAQHIGAELRSQYRNELGTYVSYQVVENLLPDSDEPSIDPPPAA